MSANEIEAIFWAIVSVTALVLTCAFWWATR